MAAAKPPADTPVKTGGGGNDDEPQEVGLTIGGDSDEAMIIKRRKDLVTAGADNESRLGTLDWSFNPGSLLGSWFHVMADDGHIEMQGVIVGELASMAGMVYLCQMDRLEPGAEQVQVLRRFDQMVEEEWRFYDSEADAKTAFAKWVATERQRV